MFFKQNRLRICFGLPVLLGLWTAVTKGELIIQQTPQYPVVGGSVTLTVPGIIGRIEVFIWFKGTEELDSTRILTYFPGDSSLARGPLFHKRMEVFPNGSLKISNLKKTDDDDYLVTITTDRAEQFASLYLKVNEAVGKPTITSSSSEPKEYDPVTLICTSTKAERITWSRVSGSISSGVTFSSDNKTLTWPRITRTDTGAYQCKGENPISSSISDLYTLTVSYGPEDVKIIQRLGNAAILLECWAESVPPPDYQWTLNGTNVTQRQETLHIDPSKPENTGIYMCVATNRVTHKTDHASINVLETSVSPQQDVGNRIVITIGTVIAVVLLIVVGVLVYIFLIRRWQKQSKSTSKVKKTSSSGPVYENAAAIQRSMPTRPTQVIEMSNAVVTPESHYAQLGAQDKAVYSTLVL